MLIVTIIGHFSATCSHQGTKSAIDELVQASSLGNYGDVVAILARDDAPDVDAQNQHGQIALVQAVDGSHEDIIHLLLEHGCDVNAVSGQDETALIVAAQRGSLDLVSRLLDQTGVDVHFENAPGFTALKIAAAYGHAQIVQVLLRAGADPNHADDLGEIAGGQGGGETALMIAAAYGHEEVARILLENGAKVNKRSKDGRTALVATAVYGQPNIAELLLKHGANVEFRYRTPDGEHFATVTEIAQMQKNSDVVDVLNAAEVIKRKKLEESWRELHKMLIENQVGEYFEDIVPLGINSVQELALRADKLAELEISLEKQTAISEAAKSYIEKNYAKEL